MSRNQSSSRVDICEYRPRDIIVSSGAAPDLFYVVLHGKVEILYQNTSIRVVGEGDVFGMEFFYLQQPYSLTARAFTAARVASYHTDMISDIIYKNPQLTQRLFVSITRQLEVTSQAALERCVLPDRGRDTTAALRQGAVQLQGLQDLPKPAPAFQDIRASVTNQGDRGFHDELLGFFLDESASLLRELESIGESLKLVGIPSDEESHRLNEFAQKLNRLIGGTAAMGFEQFAELSRKTSLLAAQCAQTKEITIRILISNLNLVISVLAECFESIEALEMSKEKIPVLDQRIDICMTALGISEPEIKSQDEIDSIMENHKSTALGESPAVSEKPP